MRLYVPDINHKLVLAEDWSFTLHDEWRNEKFLALVQPNFKELREPGHWYGKNSYTCVLPAGTELIVARVYIRNGAEEYSSLTFRIDDCPFKTWRKKRFWAKLRDVNRIEFYDE